MAQGSRRDPQRQRYWRGVIEQQAASGQSVRAWCRRHRVAESAFYFWRGELARRNAQANTTPPSASGATKPSAGFVPVAVTADGTNDHRGRIEIVLGDGRSVRLTGPVDRQALADVVAVLEARAC